MIDTWNPAQINDAIQNGSIGSGGGGPDIPTPEAADNGKFLGVADGAYSLQNIPETYTPVNYSIQEQDTGLKWIDNRPIYQKTYTGTAGTTFTQLEADFANEIIKTEGYIYKNGLGVSIGGISNSNTWTFAVHVAADNSLGVSTGNDTNGGDYVVTVFYVKPETETKKKKK